MNRRCVVTVWNNDGAWYSRVLKWLLLACILCQAAFPAESANSEQPNVDSDDLRYPPRNIQFTRITMADGLSQSAIHAITQDGIGYLWFGTQEGLNRYDGYEIVVYEHDVTDQNSLSNDWIWTLFADAQGNIWVGTNGGGLNRFDSGQNRFTRFRHDPDNSNSIGSDRVRIITQDRSGIYWIGTDGAGLSRYDAQKQLFQHYRFSPADPHSIPSDNVTDILQDRQGNLWIGTEAGLARLDSGVFTRYQHDPQDPASLSGDHVRAITEHLDGRLWIGTHNRGLNLFDPETGESERFRHESSDSHSLGDDLVRDVLVDDDGTVWVATDSGLSEWRPEQGGFVSYAHRPTDITSLSDNRINSLYQDEGGVLWVGTYNGMNRWNYASDTFSNYQKDSGYLSHDVVNAISESRSGVLWIGTYGGGLNRLDLDSGRSQVYRHDASDPGSLRDDRVMAIQVDHNDDVWVGTRTGGLSRLNQTTGKFQHYLHDPADLRSLSANGVTSIHCDSDGTVWVGTYGGGLNKFEPETATFHAYRHSPGDPWSISSDRVLNVYRGRSGDLWVGTEDGGLNRFDESSERFERFLHDPADPSSISSNTAWELYESSDGSLWIGTLGGGLNRWSYRDRVAGNVHFQKYRKSNGLKGDTVFGVLEDSKGYIWLSGNRGLTRLDPRSGKVRHFDRRNGVRGDEFNFGARLRSKTGSLLFGGIKGFVSFDPDRVHVNVHEPPIVITAQSILQSAMTVHSRGAPASFLLHYTDYFISFDFAALDFASPDKNQYRYILEGFDEDWNDPGQYRRATYTKLPAGDYTFRVRAANSDGLWNQQDVSLNLQVIPPPWLSPIAYTFYLLLLVGAIVGYVFWQNRKLVQEAQQRQILEHKVKLRTKELQQRNAQLQELSAKMTGISMQDSLTGLYNRRYLHETMKNQIANVDRQLEELIAKDGSPELLDGNALFFMMIDLDGFKHINDTYGHTVGDQVLLQVSEILKTSTRSGDTIIRWGGDEFLIFGRGRSLVGVEHLAERVRVNILDHHYVLGDGRFGRLSGSIGFAPYPFTIHQPKLISWEQVSSIADQAVYMAKHNGRNAWVGISGNENTELEDLKCIKEADSTLIDQDRIDITLSCGDMQAGLPHPTNTPR